MGWTLRRDGEKGEIGLLLDHFGHAMALDELQIISPFPRPMEKQDQRPLLRLHGIGPGQEKQVADLIGVGPGPPECVCLLHAVTGHRVLLATSTYMWTVLAA